MTIRARSRRALCLVLAAGLAGSGAPPAFAGGDEDFQLFGYEKLSLEEALNIKTQVASRSWLSTRETPGIVTIVTREQIQNSGARDLLDVLRQVPGFEIGVDVTGVVGIGFRGMWGQEGKILVLLDGQELNDLGYAGTQIDRVPIEQVERVEIVRGPGSVIYGGNAEIAVISVITRGAREKGTQAAARYGRGEKGGDRRSFDLHYGGDSDGLLLSAAAHVSKAERSDRLYTDTSGETIPMRKNSDLVSKDFNLGLQKGGFRGRLIVDEFDTTQRDSFGDSQSRATRVDGSLLLGEVSYDLKPADGWTITPKVNFNHQDPYKERDEFFLYDKTYDRYKESLTAAYDWSSEVSLLAGAEVQQDYARVSDDTPAGSLWPNGGRAIGYRTQAYFAQAQAGSAWGTVVAGGRYEYNSASKDSLVPRVAWTKVWDRLNMKALYSQAFRAPSIENIRLNPAIRPERMTTYELETGYRFRDDLYASLALFDMTIRNAIVYHNDPLTNTESYSNDGPTGSRGAEVVGRWKGSRGYADASYSFYSATKNRVPFYAVPGHGGALLGWPMHKVAVNASVALGAGFSANPSAVWLAERYGYSGLDRAGNPASGRFPNAVLLGFFLRKNDAFVRGLDLSAGVSDLLASGYSYIQPYNGGHSPLPGPSREVSVKAGYAF